jgi:hypothetical protein
MSVQDEFPENFLISDLYLSILEYSGLVCMKCKETAAHWDDIDTCNECKKTYCTNCQISCEWCDGRYIDEERCPHCNNQYETRNEQLICENCYFLDDEEARGARIVGWP